MGSLVAFLRALLLRAPLEFLITVLRILFLVLAILPAFLLRLWEWLCALLKRGNLYPEESESPCGRVPESVVRRPDPCIYSQRLLQSQGLPVTWNNPDIWVARADDPTNIEPDSYHLIEDTDYIVSVRAHNASTDAAIGVRVRLNYRPWSFNSPDLVPVETDSNGDEVVQFVHIGPIPASAIAQFRWHTPKLDADQAKKHFCLQASVYHPLDTNPDNNMGQENTNVWQSANPGHVAPGQVVQVPVPLFNRAKREEEFRFEALRYAVDREAEVELRLETTKGYARRPNSIRLANSAPSLQYRTAAGAEVSTNGRRWPRLRFETQPNLIVAKNRYEGFEPLRDKLLKGDHSLPDGMTVTVDGAALDRGVTLGPGEPREMRVDIQVPPTARVGDTFPITLVARTANGVLVGGVTVILNVDEEN